MNVISLHNTVGWLSCMACAMLATTAHAQETSDSEASSGHPVTTLTPRQMELNNEATLALNQDAPDTTRAVAKLQEALELGEGADLLYMSLGRAYQYEDQCASAEEAFKLAEQAPRLTQISHEVILEKIARYRSESAQMCSGSVTFVCDALDIKFTVEQDATLVCNQSGTFPAGHYEVEISRDDTPLERTTILVTGMVDQKLDMTDMIAARMQEERDDTAKPFLITGASVTALGVGTLGAGLITAIRLNNELENQNLSFEQAESRRTRRGGLYIAGGALSAIGLVTLSLGVLRRRATSEQDMAWTPALHVDHRGAHASFMMRF